MFSAFYDQHEEYGRGRSFGVIVGDFVDVDELYPCSPIERVRHDATGVLGVAEEILKKTNTDGEEEEELVAVLRRSWLLRMHPSDMLLLLCVVEEMRDSIAKWEDVMLTKMREIVDLQVSSSLVAR